MLRRPYIPGSTAPICRACGLASSPARQWTATPQLSRRTADIPHHGRLIPPVAVRSFTTSRPCLKVNRTQSAHKAAVPQNRFGRTSSPVTDQQPSLDPAEVAARVDHVLRFFLGPVGIPEEGRTIAALRELARIDVRPALEAAERRTEDIVTDTQRPASDLLGLEGAAAQKAGDAARPQRIPSQRLLEAIDKVSNAAYMIVNQPAVVITRDVLEEYVKLQARLGRPQTLPEILVAFASKPKPKLASGTIRYVERNPANPDNAVDPAVADVALDAALEAQDLEAAIGILEATYSSKAFLRSKLIKKGVLPAFAVAGTPVALYFGATQLAQLQHSLEPQIATGMAFAGALCYVGFTASIGLVAHFTANDQMKRVTWALGTPLRHRWLHEEERAALDKIACAFGFSEEHRYGEEEGEEFLWLREYILSKSMILDAVDLMPGMN